MQILLLKTQLLKTLLFLHMKWQSESYVQFALTAPTSIPFLSHRELPRTQQLLRGVGTWTSSPTPPVGVYRVAHAILPALPWLEATVSGTTHWIWLWLVLSEATSRKSCETLWSSGKDLLSRQRCRQSSWCFKSEWKKHEDTFEEPALCSFLKGRRPSLTVTSSLPLSAFSWPHPVKSVPSRKARRPLLSHSATTQDLPSTHTR